MALDGQARKRALRRSARPPCGLAGRSSPMELNQYEIRMLLHPLEGDFAAIE